VRRTALTGAVASEHAEEGIGAVSLRRLVLGSAV